MPIRRYHNRWRNNYRRRFTKTLNRFRKRYPIRKKTRYQRAIGKQNRLTKKLKRKSKTYIQRPLQQNFIIKRFSRINYVDYSMQYLNQSGVKGSTTSDYTLNNLMLSDELAYIKSRYLFGNLLSFTITFFMSDQDNIQQRWDTSGPTTNQATTQVVDTREALLMFVGHFNSANHQLVYNWQFDSDPNVAHQQLRAKLTTCMRRLKQSGKVTQHWTQPTGYRSTYAPISTWDDSSPLDFALAGAPGNEPHGFVFWFPMYSVYATNASAQRINIGYRIDSTFAFKDFRPVSTATG